MSIKIEVSESGLLDSLTKLISRKYKIRLGKNAKPVIYCQTEKSDTLEKIKCLAIHFDEANSE